MSGYDELRSLIPKLATDVFWGDGVDSETVQNAMKVLELLEFVGAMAPRIFWHGGDAIVFEWDQRAMITISGNDSQYFHTLRPSKALEDQEHDS